MVSGRRTRCLTNNPRPTINTGHMLFLYGVSVGFMPFRWVQALTSAELSRLTLTLAQRASRDLKRRGLL